MSEVKYVEVKRKARKGEKVRVFGHVADCANGTFTVERADKEGTIYYHTNCGGSYGTPYYSGKTYVVLEPMPQSTNFTEVLTQFLRDNADEVRRIIGAAPNEPVKVADNNVLTRGKVIAQAKADVAELERIGGANSARLPAESPFYSKFYKVKYHVNRSKRAVTALIYGRYGITGIQAKNTAKCAPGEVFNADIGKAIALRRALGLTVPAEYINSPQPELPRVGARVNLHSLNGDVSYGVRTIRRMRPDKDGSRFGNYAVDFADYSGWAGDEQYEVIDDTDVDYNANETEVAS